MYAVPFGVFSLVHSRQHTYSSLSNSFSLFGGVVWLMRFLVFSSVRLRGNNLRVAEFFVSALCKFYSNMTDTPYNDPLPPGMPCQGGSFRGQYPPGRFRGSGGSLFRVAVDQIWSTKISGTQIV